MAKMELEVGPSPTGVMLAIKSVEGRMHQVMAIEVTNDGRVFPDFLQAVLEFRS